MTDSLLEAVPAAEAGERTRHKKRPHNLHLCNGPDDLARELRAKEIDPLSLVYEFVKPSFDVGLLCAGSIASGIATELSDLDLWVLLPSAEAFKSKRPREVAGSAVNYLPMDKPNRAEVSFYPAGIEVDISFVINPAVDRYAASAVRESALEKDAHVSDTTFVSRLATGWVLHGPAAVQRWRGYYETDKLRIKWMTDDFTLAAKNLEDMEAGIGRAKGHVPAIGVYCVTKMLRALLAFHGCYTTSVKWMLRLDRLIGSIHPEMREVLVRGRELAFPTLLESPAEERAYFERVYEYCGIVRNILSREEGVGDILTSVIHDLDLIL